MSEKKALSSSDTLIGVILVDAGEQAIERPQKSKKNTIAVKKKRHTQKVQVLSDKSPYTTL